VIGSSCSASEDNQQSISFSLESNFSTNLVQPSSSLTNAKDHRCHNAIRNLKLEISLSSYSGSSTSDVTALSL